MTTSEVLSHYTSHRRNVYMESLLDPDLKLDAKIPAIAPIPTSSIQVRHSVVLSTNASGNVAFSFSPRCITTNVNTATVV